MGLFYLKRGDTRPVLVVTLRDPDKTAHDLTGATAVWMHVTLAGDGGVFSRLMDMDADRTTGKASYTWLATDWTAGTPKMTSGNHSIEYEVLGPSGARQTFPNRKADNDALQCDDDMEDAS